MATHCAASHQAPPYRLDPAPALHLLNAVHNQLHLLDADCTQWGRPGWCGSAQWESTAARPDKRTEGNSGSGSAVGSPPFGFSFSPARARLPVITCTRAELSGERPVNNAAVNNAAGQRRRLGWPCVGPTSSMISLSLPCSSSKFSREASGRPCRAGGRAAVAVVTCRRRLRRRRGGGAGRSSRQSAAARTQTLLLVEWL